MQKTTTPQKGLNCINCGQPFQGNENFCPSCGQANDIRRVSVKEMVLHFFGGFFAFDNLFFRTLKPLLFSPGKVTKEYIEGKRKSYTNPFIFMLHSAIVFLLVSGLVETIESTQKLNETMQQQHQEYLFQKKVKKYFSNIEVLTQLRNDTINLLEKEKIIKKIMEDSYVDNSSDNDQNIIKFNMDTNGKSFQKKIVQKELDRFEIPYTIQTNNDSIFLTKNKFELSVIDNKYEKMINEIEQNPEISTLEGLKKNHIKATRFNIIVFEKMKKIGFLDFNNDWKGLLNQVFSKIPMALFIVLPLFTLTFSLLYFRKHFTYTEHLITVFNIQSAFFWVMIIALLLKLTPVPENWTNRFVLLIMLIYIYKTLRYVFNQTRFKTILKLMIINLSYIITASLGLILLFAITLVFI